MKTTALLPALGLAILLAGTTARAQSDADASVPLQPAAGSSDTTIRLTPPAPDGGVYGAGSTVATPPPDAPAVDVAAPPPAPVTTLVLPPPPPPPVQLTMPELYGERAHRVSLTRQRLRLLDGMLPPLAARSRSQRVFDGVVTLIIGSTLTTVGIVLETQPSLEVYGPMFWIIGGVEVIQGIVTLAWIPARETLTDRFMAMPMNTAAERRDRVRYGEWAVNEMAADGTRRRVINAVTGAVLPLAVLAALYVPVLETPGYVPGVVDYLVIGLGAVGVVTALIPLFGHSEEERLRSAYFQQLRLMQAEQGAVGP